MKRSIIQTNNLALASALAAVGIPFDEENPFTKTLSHRGGEQYTFYFQGVSTCGAYQTRDLIKAWNDDKWHTKNDSHPFAYIKCAFQNRESLLDLVNQSQSLVVIEKGGKLAIVSSNASEAFQNDIFSRL